MTFDELKNGMKSLFFSLGAKTSDSNYAVGLYDKTSAEPKGLMGMSDLASVLGVPALYRNPGTASGTILEYDGGYALIKVSDISSGKNAIFLQAANDANSITMLAGDQSRFTTTKDTSGMINVYGVSEYKFAVQQNTTSTKSLDIAIICPRN